MVDRLGSRNTLMITKRDTFARTDADRNVQTAPATRIALVAAVAMVIAFIVNALIRIVAVEVFDASGDDAPMVWGAILAATVVATAIAALIYWVLGRFTQRPVRTFSIVAAIVLAISIIGPV